MRLSNLQDSLIPLKQNAHGMNKLKRPGILLTLAAGIPIFYLLQSRYAFHLYFLEQHQLFLSGKEYARELLSQPGGFITYASEFIIRFFIQDYIGSLSITILLILTGISLHRLQRSEPESRSPVFLFEGLILLFLLINILDTAFYLKGITGYLLCVLTLLMYNRITFPGWWKRTLYGLLLALILFWLAAPFQSLFLITAGCIELRKQGFNKGKSLFFWILFAGSAYLTYQLWGNSTYRTYIALDGTCSFRIIPGWTKYAAWVLLPASVLLSPLLEKPACRVKKRYLLIITQALLLSGTAVYLLPNYDDNWSLPFKRLNHYATQERWDDILSYCRQYPTGEYTCLNYQNLALAKKGILADSLLAYPQEGAYGLVAPWDRIDQTAFILQEIYYFYGSIAFAQRYAFEGNVSSNTTGFPQTMKMLVRTNILKEEYAVATKYIRYLQQTPFYKEWAGKQYRYITGEESMEDDPEYSSKQTRLQAGNYLMKQNDLFTIAKADKGNTALRDFILCYHLLNKDLERFLGWIYFYYEEAEKKEMPAIYYEGIMACAPHMPEAVELFQIPDTLKKEFERYADIYNATQNPAEREEWLSVYFETSFWFYYHFKEIDNV